MNTTSNPPAHLGDIVDRWKSSARAGGWRAMGDWSVSSVPAVATAAITGVDDALATTQLGRARAIAGVGIAEGLDDLDRLWVLLGDVGAPSPASRAFAEGWADAAAAPAARPALDSSSGLATADVLRIRIDDLVRTDRTAGSALVVVDAVDAALPRFARHLEVAAIGALIGETLVGGETPVRIDHDRVAAIVPRDAELDEGVIRLRRALDRRTPGRATDGVRLSALPTASDDVLEWLALR